MASANVFLFVGLICATLISIIAGPVTKCDSHDAKCLKQSTQDFLPVFAAGIQQYNIQSMDPLHIKSVDASSPNLKLVIKDMSVYGLKNCVAKKIERSETTISAKLLCNVRAEGQYEMHGRLLVLPIEGNGKAHVKLNSILMNVDSEIVNKNGKDGKKYWHIKSSSFNFQLKDKSEVRFENLFSGNKLLARAAEDLIANNGNDIVVEIGPPVIKAIVDKIIENINHFYRAVPAEDLALN